MRALVWWLMLWLLTGFSSCHYECQNLEKEELNHHTRDSLSYLYQYHYTWNTNLELYVDSVKLECLPVKGSYQQLFRGDRVVVVEFAVHPQDSVDSVWVKLAHSQEVQGWIRESEMKQVFVPTDSVSVFIYTFSRTHVSYFLFVLALFIGVWLMSAFHKRRIRLVYFNDIDSVYPVLLCLLMAISATIYEGMQVFVPETWEHFYYNPTLSPFQVPFVLSLFLISIWLLVVVLLAAIDDVFHQLSFVPAVFYLLGLTSVCILCYFFFIFTTHYYVGYIFLALFCGLILRHVLNSLRCERYSCGACGAKLNKKGVCPHCGALNQ